MGWAKGCPALQASESYHKHDILSHSSKNLEKPTNWHNKHHAADVIWMKPELDRIRILYFHVGLQPQRGNTYQPRAGIWKLGKVGCRLRLRNEKDGTTAAERQPKVAGRFNARFQVKDDFRRGAAVEQQMILVFMGNTYTALHYHIVETTRDRI